MIIKKNQGFTLFEMILSITISAIVFTIAGIFVGRTVEFAANISQNTANSVANTVPLNILGGDFSDYKSGSGGVQITNQNNLITAKFNVVLNNTYIQYQCDYSNATAYRIVGSPASNNVFLNNIQSCNFITYNSSDGKTIFLDATFVINNNSKITTLSQVYSAKA